MIVLKNKLREPKVYEVHPRHLGGQHTKIGAADRNKEGGHALKVHHRCLPDSITLMSAGTRGSESKPLPDSVAQDETIAAAQRRGDLEIITLPAAPAPAASEEKTEPAQDSGTTEPQKVS